MRIIALVLALSHVVPLLTAKAEKTKEIETFLEERKNPLDQKLITTEDITEEPTEDPTEAPIDLSTDAPSDVPTYAPSIALDCSDKSYWDKDDKYVKDDIVFYDGIFYKLKVEKVCCKKNKPPKYSKIWTVAEECDPLLLPDLCDDIVEWDEDKDYYRMYKKVQYDGMLFKCDKRRCYGTPSKSHKSWKYEEDCDSDGGGGEGNCEDIKEWSKSKKYRKGDEVQRDGKLYECGAKKGICRGPPGKSKSWKYQEDCDGDESDDDDSDDESECDDFQDWERNKKYKRNTKVVRSDQLWTCKKRRGCRSQPKDDSEEWEYETDC